MLQRSLKMSTANDEAHWIEVVDGKGLFPAKLLGPYATARLADRAQRGVMRLLNVARYTAVVMSQRDLEGRNCASGIAHDPPS